MTVLRDSLQDIREWIRHYDDYTSTSLPQYTRKCSIASPVYIEDVLLEEPVTADLLTCLHNIYVGYILTALRMNSYVVNSRTVRDMLDTVSTESKEVDYVDSTNIADDFASMNWSNATPAMETTKASTTILSKDLKELMLPSGRVIEFKFGDPDDPKNQMTANIFVQMKPRAIPTQVCSQIVALNFTPDLKKRWLQVLANEKSFIKDFVLQLDLTKQKADALKKDKTGILKELLDQQSNNLFRQLMKLTFLYPDKQNIANSVFIMDSISFKRACTNAHMDFRNPGNRRKFFGASYSMMLATIDSRYNRVQLYIAGNDSVSEFTFNQLLQNTKKDKMDMVELMKAIGTSNSLRF